MAMRRAPGAGIPEQIVELLEGWERATFFISSLNRPRNTPPVLSGDLRVDVLPGVPCRPGSAGTLRVTHFYLREAPLAGAGAPP